MDSMQEILLFHFTGDDRPGLTASLTGILAQHNISVLDMNQTVIHRTLLLGMLVRIPKNEGSTELLKDLLFMAHHLGLRLRMSPVEDGEYDAWVSREGAPRFILTLLTRQLTAKHVAAVSSIISEQGLNIDIITRLSGRPPRIDDGKPRRACVEFSVRGKPKDEDDLRAKLMEVTQHETVDIAWQRDSVYRRTRRLVAFDMDSTLIQHEVIDELAKEAGVGEAVVKITEAAMHGEIDFDESLKRRVALLKGLSESVMEEIADRLRLTEGAERLVSALRSFGYKTAIISGGFSYFGQHLKKLLDVDYVYTNDLEIERGKLTGRVKGEIVNAQRKAEILKEIAAKENISLQQTIAVGDGANDMDMLSAAGLGIAFNAKPIVADAADMALNQPFLDPVLFILGITRDEVEAADAQDGSLRRVPLAL